MASRTSWNMLRKDMKRFPCLYPVSQLQLGEKWSVKVTGGPLRPPPYPDCHWGGATSCPLPHFPLT